MSSTFLSGKRLLFIVASSTLFFTPSVSAATETDRLLALPYDGEISPRTLRSQGHATSRLYSELEALTRPLTKDEFEKSSDFLERSKPENRELKVKEKYGEIFLHVNELAWDFYNKEFTYDADKELLSFNFLTNPFDITIFRIGSFASGHILFGNEKIPTIGCKFPDFISVDPINAKNIKQGAIGIAVKFSINYSKSEYLNKDLYDTKRDGSQGAKYNEKLEKHTGYFKLISTFRNVKQYRSSYPNWSAAEMYLFKKSSGAIIVQGTCS